jgi:acyl-CoA synthetase (AMP-forming)/AMP-acid ligase II
MGDTVYADAEGLLWLVGRVHSTIARGGVLMHPQLVEAAARGDDRRIRRVAAVGQPDPTLGEAVAVVVQIDSGDDPQTVAGDVRRRLQSAGFPNDRLIVTRDPLPVDPRHNSKIDYPVLRSRLAEGKVAVLVDLAPVNHS